MKRVMMEIGLLVVGLSLAGLHTLVCYRLFGLVVTLVIVGVQVVIASYVCFLYSVIGVCHHIAQGIVSFLVLSGFELYGVPTMRTKLARPWP